MTHETAIAQNVITEAEKHGHVTAIKLDIGELAHVPGTELIECLKQLRPKWDIAWTERESHVTCECGFSGRPVILERGHDHFLIECPQCGDTPDLDEGTQIKILNVTV